jgi:hypothetical protein
MLSAKRPTENEKAQSNEFDEDCYIRCSVVHFHAVLPVGLAADDDEAIPHRGERQLVETLALPQIGDA